MNLPYVTGVGRNKRTFRTLGMLTRVLEARGASIKEFSDHWLIVTWRKGEMKYEVTRRRDCIEIDSHLYWDLDPL